MVRGPGNYEQRARLFCAIHDHLASMPTATPYFRDKYSHLADPVLGTQLVALMEYWFSVAGADPCGCTVLDAGCGAGLHSVAFCALGAARVLAVDLFPENVLALADVARKFSLPIEAFHGDVADTRLPDGSVDLVYCDEAISHFRDWQGFAREAHRLLRPGGRLLVSDGNNGANRRVTRGIHDDWERSECGPFTVDQFPPGKSNLPYLFRRWMILQEHFPQLSPDDLFRLGMHTAGVGGADLIEAGAEFLRTRVLPRGGYRRGQSQSRPEDAQKNEEPLDPREVAAYLTGVGVDSRVRPHFGFNRNPRLFAALNRVASWITPLSLPPAPAYLLFGTKRRG